MQFHYWDLGRRTRGEIVEVTLTGSAANVRLIDNTNYTAFKAGRRHRFVGGHAKRSPVRLQVPHSDHWYVTVDYGGHRGRGRAAVEVQPGALPELSQRSMPSLAPIGQSVATMLADDESSARNREWDVFVSHATEDKDEVVRPLALALRDRGLRVWYDEFELRIGSSLRRNIDQGLARSRFGAIILSPAFFEKNWSQYELDGLVTREMTGEQIILPIWHKMTKAEVIKHSPSLADKLARNTSSLTVEEIAEEIASLIRDS